MHTLDVVVPGGSARVVAPVGELVVIDRSS